MKMFTSFSTRLLQAGYCPQSTTQTQNKVFIIFYDGGSSWDRGSMLIVSDSYYNNSVRYRLNSQPKFDDVDVSNTEKKNYERKYPHFDDFCTISYDCEIMISVECRKITIDNKYWLIWERNALSTNYLLNNIVFNHIVYIKWRFYPLTNRWHRSKLYS